MEKDKYFKNSLLFGRNAGFIDDRKNKFRICQSYLPGRYGAGIFINKINNISKKITMKQ